MILITEQKTRKKKKMKKSKILIIIILLILILILTFKNKINNKLIIQIKIITKITIK